MADFKAQIRSNQLRSDKTTNIKIRITHNRKTRYIKTEFYVKLNQFDEKEGKVKNHENASYINIQLRNRINEYERLVLKQGPTINFRDIQAIIDLLKTSKDGELDFHKHLDNYINRLEKEGRESYASTFRQTKDRLKDYSPSEFLPFSQVDYSFLKGFESHYNAKKMSVNAIGIHLRNIRTIYNDAINADLVGQEFYPFRRFKIKKAPTQHRNLEPNDIARFIKYKPATKTEERFKDLALLSFYLLGVNFKDLLLAKKDQIDGGRFYYTRSKTKKQYSIKIFPEAKAIINKYKGEEDYLLRFMEDKIKNNIKKDRKGPLYKDVTDQTNRTLKNIFVKLGMGRKISTYYMRHSWASIADELEIPKTVISLAMGHGSNSVTDVYIYTDLKRVDEANKKVINHLKKIMEE